VGRLTNTGSIQSNASTSSQNFLDGNVVNNGAVAISFNTTNENNGSWTNTGTLTIASGGALVHGGGGFTWTSGTITNNGTLRQDGASLTTGSGTLSGNPILLNGRSDQPERERLGVFDVHGSVALASDVASGYVLNVKGGGGYGSARLFLTANRTNGGTIHVTADDATGYAWLDDNGFTLTNSATISVDPGGGNAGRYWYGPVVNAATGTITINEEPRGHERGPVDEQRRHHDREWQGGPLSNGLTWSSGPITNNGTFTLNGGTLTTGSGTLTGNPIVLNGAAISPNGTGSAAFVVRGGSTLAADVASGNTRSRSRRGGFGSPPSPSQRTARMPAPSTRRRRHRRLGVLNGGGSH